MATLENSITMGIVFIMTLCINDGDTNHTDLNDVADARFEAGNRPDRKTICNFRIAENSANEFQHLVQIKKVNFMYIKFNFSQVSSISKDYTFLFPYFLTWTFKEKAGAGYPLVFYPFDFDLLSLGFLSWYVYDYLDVNIEVIGPAGCYAEWGAPYTMKQLLIELRNMTSATDYQETTVWCYDIKFNLPDITNFIDHVTGVNRYSSGPKCSEPENPYLFDKTYEQTRWLTFFSVCGIFLLCYSPLFLHLFDGRSEIEIKAINLDMYKDNKHGNYVEIEEVATNDDLILYLGDEPPITVLSTLKWCFRKLSSTQSLVITCLSRIFFLTVISPVFIYIRMALVYNYKYRALYGRIEKDIPLGFNAVPFGFQVSSRNWMYFLGGPYVIYSLFFIIAGTVLCIPKNISAILCARLGDASDSELLQCLDPSIIENLGGLEFTSMNVGWALLASSMRARLYMLLNWKFWRLFINTWVQRLQGLVRRSKYLSKCLFFTFMIPVWFVCVLAIVLDLVFCIISYGIPIWLFTKNLITNYATFCVDRFIWKKINRENAFVNHILAWIMNVFIFLVFFYILLCYYTIYTSSMTYIFQTISFTLIGIVAFPAEAITYTVMYTTIILYIYKAVNRINVGYIDLLYKTIRISERLQKSKSDDNGKAFVVYHENIPGVYKDVFDHVVEKHFPVRVQLFLSAVYLSFIGTFIYASISVVQAYNRQAQLSVVVQALAAVLAGILPQLVEFFWSSANDKVKEKRFKRTMEHSIVKYWEKRDRCLPDSESTIA